MKTYYEMTESVLEKARTDIVKKERKRRNGVFIAASGFCAVLLLTVIGAGLKQTPAVIPTLPVDQPGLWVDATDPTRLTDSIDTTQPMEQQGIKVMLLSSVGGQERLEPVFADVSFPLNSHIKIRDIRGLTDEERERALEEENAVLNGSKSVYYNDGFISTRGSRNAIWSVTHNGKLTLDFSNCPKLSNVEIKTTGVGTVERENELTAEPPLGGKNLWPYTYKASLNWSLSGKFIKEFEKNPEYRLESIRDTITITINYANGTAETLIFDITVNEEGQIFVTQRGIPTTAA